MDEILVTHHDEATFEAIHLTLAQHVEIFVLPALRRMPEQPIDMVYDQLTPLQALYRLLDILNAKHDGG